MVAALDAGAYPHIFELVASYAEWETLLALRRLSRKAMAKVDKQMVQHVALVCETRPGGGQPTEECFIVLLREPWKPFRRIPVSHDVFNSPRFRRRALDVRCIDAYPIKGDGARQLMHDLPNAIVRFPWQIQPWALYGTKTREAVYYQTLTHRPDHSLYVRVKWLCAARGSDRVVTHVRIKASAGKYIRGPIAWCFPMADPFKSAVLVLKPCPESLYSAARDDGCDQPNCTATRSGVLDEEENGAEDLIHEGTAAPPWVRGSTCSHASAWLFHKTPIPPLGILHKIPDTAAALLACGSEVSIVGLENIHPALLGIYHGTHAPASPSDVQEIVVAAIRRAGALVGTDDDPQLREEVFYKHNSVPRPYGGDPDPALLGDNFELALKNLSFPTLKEWEESADWRESTQPPIPDHLVGWAAWDGYKPVRRSGKDYGGLACTDLDGVAPSYMLPGPRPSGSDYADDYSDHTTTDDDWDEDLDDDWEQYEAAAAEFYEDSEDDGGDVPANEGDNGEGAEGAHESHSSYDPLATAVVPHGLSAYDYNIVDSDEEIGAAEEAS